MGSFIVDERWLRLADTLAPQPCIVVFHLLAHASANLITTVNRRALAARLEVSIGTVHRAIVAMREAGIIMEEDGVAKLIPGDLRAVSDPPARSIKFVDGPEQDWRSSGTRRTRRSSESRTGNTQTETGVRNKVDAPPEQAVSPDRGPENAVPDERNRARNSSEFTGVNDSSCSSLTSKPHNSDQDPCSTRSIAAGSEQSHPSLEADPKRTTPPSDAARQSEPSGARVGIGAIEQARTPKKRGSSKPRSVRSLKLAELHPASVELADKLRDSCLRQQPGNTCGKVTPWNESGLRLQWAQTIEALVDKVSDGPLDAPRVRQSIERALAWLATDQGCSEAKYRIIVLSASALAEKWDRIAARCAPQPSRKPAEITLHASTTRKLAVAPPEISRHRIDSGVPE